MKVKTCPECVYSPEDLGDNYDRNAAIFVCGRCPAQGLLCFARGYYIREGVLRQPERTYWHKRQEAANGEAPTTV